MATSAEADAATPVHVLTGLALSTGSIHVVASIQHVGDSRQLGVLFALAAAVQLTAGWRIHRRPDDRHALLGAAIACAAIAVIWILSRTVGVPFGPDAGDVESVGVADTIATLEEIALAAIVTGTLWRPRAGRLAWLSSPLGLRFTIALISAALFVAALYGHEH